MPVSLFTQLNSKDQSIAGGKGASLGEMTGAGIPVPPGFVILAETFDKFVDNSGANAKIASILKKVDPDKSAELESASEKIQQLILNTEVSSSIAEEILAAFKNLKTDFVAVRSSATVEDGKDNAWAGQLDTFLNTNAAMLIDNVRKCWASLFTPRAIFYRFENKLQAKKISVAVVVQAMIASEVSGVAFSVHPVTEDRNQIVIEAGFGLGEAIVSGQITPDNYVLAKNPLAISYRNISEQERAIVRAINGGDEWQKIPLKKQTAQKLDDANILKLARLILKIEKHYGFPCDIEWAFAKNKLYILQSRPITTLK